MVLIILSKTNITEKKTTMTTKHTTSRNDGHTLHPIAPHHNIP